MRYIVVCFFLSVSFLMILSASSCFLFADIKKDSRELTKGEGTAVLFPDSLKIDLSKCADEPPAILEFAANNSEYLLAAWHSSVAVNNYERSLGKSILFDFSGNIVEEMGHEQGERRASYVNLFPNSFDYLSYNEIINDCSIGKIGNGWGFSKDGQFAVRLTKNDTFARWKVEFYKHDNTYRKIWTTWLPTTVGIFIKAEFINWGGSKCLLITLTGEKGYILSQEKGQVIKVFTYGPPNTDKSRKAYKRKFNLWFSDAISLNFSVTETAYDPHNRILACGDFNSKRVRIISIDKPEELRLEMNSDSHPKRPIGGHWWVRGIEFNGGGKYLIIEYIFMGRFTEKVFHPTEIYNVDNWEMCRIEDSGDVGFVTLSPDGERIAFMRNMILEIGPFRPKQCGWSSGDRSSQEFPRSSGDDTE